MKSKAMNPKKKRLLTQIMVIAIIVVIYVICHFLTGGRLLTLENIKEILIQVSYPLMVSLGMMFIFSGGMIDLSIGAQVILAANIGAVLVTDYQLGYVGLILGTLVGMLVCEFLSASCSVFLGIPSWVAGLGAALVFEAIATIYVNARSARIGAAKVMLKDCRILGQGSINIGPVSIPLFFVIAIVMFVIAYIIFNHTKLGFNLRAIGGGGEVAEAMGIKRKKTIILAALVGAAIIAVGGICQVSYIGYYTTSAGMGSLSGIFKALAIILISGSFSRIFNDAVGVLVGSFIVGGLFNVLTLLGVPTGTWQDVALGAVVLICGILSSVGYKGVMK